MNMIYTNLNPVIAPPEPPDELPVLIRPMPLRVDGKPVDEWGFLGRYKGRIRTFGEFGYMAGLSNNVTVKGEGDHLAIKTK